MEKKIRSIPFAAMELHTQFRTGISDPQVFWDTARFLEETAKKMAEYYADYTIDKLIVARKRKGVRNSVGSHMLR